MNKNLTNIKKWQQEIVSLMANHVDADKASLITVKTVFDLVKRAKEIYESSKSRRKTANPEFLVFELGNERQKGDHNTA